MGRFVEGEDRSQSLLLPESLDDYAGEDNPVHVVALSDVLEQRAAAAERLVIRVGRHDSNDLGFRGRHLKGPRSS